MARSRSTRSLLSVHVRAVLTAGSVCGRLGNSATSWRSRQLPVGTRSQFSFRLERDRVSDLSGRSASVAVSYFRGGPRTRGSKALTARRQSAVSAVRKPVRRSRRFPLTVCTPRRLSSSRCSFGGCSLPVTCDGWPIDQLSGAILRTLVAHPFQHVPEASWVVRLFRIDASPLWASPRMNVADREVCCADLRVLTSGSQPAPGGRILTLVGATSGLRPESGAKRWA